MDINTKQWARRKYKKMSPSEKADLQALKKLCDAAANCQDAETIEPLNVLIAHYGNKQDELHGKTLVNVILDFIIK